MGMVTIRTGDLVATSTKAITIGMTGIVVLETGVISDIIKGVMTCLIGNMAMDI